jgi:signal transduction histidine kinase
MTDEQVEPSNKFRPRARLLQLLGDQLISSGRLAVFELVKNAYDADASQVNITFQNLDQENAQIVVKDDGEGMSLNTLTEVWLEPGADYREKQRAENRTSTKYNRLPLGEKGVGRFAVHKLGTQIIVNTKCQDEDENTVSIDWDAYSQHRYMDQAPVNIQKSQNPVFSQKETGTQITISGLRNKWTRGDVRRLWRNVKSISSPTKSPESFEVNLSVPEHKDWLSGLLDVPDFLDRALWHFVFNYENGEIEWTYSFKPLAGINVEKNEIQSISQSNGSILKLAPQHQKQFGEFIDGKFKKKISADKNFTKLKDHDETIEMVGPVMGEFYGFDRDKEVMEYIAEAKSLSDFLDENGGVRVYRDGVRVHNYGERSSGDDWLGLDLRRVNVPARRLSNNILIGSIDLSLASSDHPEHGLVEKTNREGFVENEAFERFKAIVLGALIEFENHRQRDKDRIKKLLKPPSERAIGDLEDPINALHEEFKKRNLSKDLGKHLTAIERKFGEMKEVMTHAGNAGLNLGILFHEIDRGVKGLTHDIKKEAPMESLLSRAEHLSQLLDGFSTLLRKDKKEDHQIRSILDECYFLNENRFAAHDVIFSCPVRTEEQESFEVNTSFGMLLGALSNLIDNSIYWLQVKWPDSANIPRQRAIYIGVTDYYEEGPAIVFADNGVGLPSNTEDLVKPFYTMKPDGMGLGLYYVNLVCELNNARLVFSPNKEDVNIPDAYDGASFAIIFNK